MYGLHVWSYIIYKRVSDIRIQSLTCVDLYDIDIIIVIYFTNSGGVLYSFVSQVRQYEPGLQNGRTLFSVQCAELRTSRT